MHYCCIKRKRARQFWLFETSLSSEHIFWCGKSERIFVINLCGRQAGGGWFVEPCPLCGHESATPAPGEHPGHRVSIQSSGWCSQREHGPSSALRGLLPESRSGGNGILLIFLSQWESYISTDMKMASYYCRMVENMVIIVSCASECLTVFKAILYLFSYLIFIITVR